MESRKAHPTSEPRDHFHRGPLGQEWLMGPGWGKAAGVFAAFQPFTR